MTDLPASARVVIIGGGIVGCSTAYHLGAMGEDEVLLLERHQLSSGSTWHAAGLVGQLRTNANVTQLLGYSVALYDRLEAETGLATGWKLNGGLRLACTPERWTEVKRQATTARSFGLEMQLLTPEGGAGSLAADDGRRRDRRRVPAHRRPGLALRPRPGAGPRRPAARRRRSARTSASPASASRAGRVTGVETDRGIRRLREGRLCAGQWSRELGRMAGVNVPLVSVQHQYLITERIAGVTPGLPTLRDPDRLTYYKEEVGGLVMGGYEPNPKPWAERGVPDGFRLPAARQRLGPFRADHGAGARPRPGAGDMPASSSSSTARRASRRTATSSSARRPEVDGFFVGAGFNAFGIASGGGAGMALAEWVANGRAALRPLAGRHPPLRPQPPLDALGPHPHARGLRQALHHGLAARGIRLRPPAPPLAALRPPRGARARSSARSSAGSGRTGSPAPATSPRDVYTFERPNWFEAVGREHRACREAAALFDQTSFAKFLLTGRDAEAALSWICANDVARPPGTLDLHPDAERPRRHRVRPHRRAPGRGRLLHRHRHRLRHPRLRTGSRRNIPARPRRPARPTSPRSTPSWR